MRAFTITAPNAGEVLDERLVRARLGLRDLALLDRTHGRGYDIVLDCTGIPAVIVKPLITRVVGLDEVAAILARPKLPAELQTLVRPNVD